MKTQYTFPFGQPVTTVDQKDTKSKKVFVLGVYASAVHAKWLSPRGKTVITALAVASEPYIFWRGDNPEKIISKIKIPTAIGTLVPAAKNLNGPSGNALDDLFLTPLGVTRENSWLCDLVPHSCLNPSQKAALDREYEPLRKKHKLPKVTLPRVPKVLADDKRRAQILKEIKKCDPKTIVLLGNEPIKWFLQHHDPSYTTLSDFGDTPETYGKPHKIKIDDNTYNVIALCHPRQAARLGSHSAKWNELHTKWLSP